MHKKSAIDHASQFKPLDDNALAKFPAAKKMGILAFVRRPDSSQCNTRRAMQLGVLLASDEESAMSENVGKSHSAAERDSAMLDVQGVATLLGCSSRHVFRMSDMGRMPRPVKLGALVRWSRAAIVNWIGQGCPNCRGGGR